MSDHEEGRCDASRISRRIQLHANRRSSGRHSGAGLEKNDDEAEKTARRVNRRSSGALTRNKENLDEDDMSSDAQDMDDYGEPAAQKTKRKAKSAGHDSAAQGKGINTAARHRISVVSRPITSALTTTASATTVAGAMVMGNTSVTTLGDIPNIPDQVPRKVMDDNFEEWMKMATDNKITANNTWGFALIDYFADITFLRNADDDQSINFQKASCTLDGCVKVWTSRVDSVATETGKLLSGLSTGRQNETEGYDEDMVGGDGEQGEEEDAQKKKQKKSRSGESTLAKSFEALKVKKLDLEFTVDPLFKKTSADFDEGGAMGLLMNHLGVDGKCRVVFDAGDVGFEDDDEEEDEEADDTGIDLDRIREFVPPLQNVLSRNISVTLADFKFSADAKSAFDVSMMMNGRDDEEDNLGRESQGGLNSAPDMPGQDFFGEEGVDSNFAGDAGGDGYFGVGDDANDVGFDDHDDASVGGPVGASSIVNGFGPSEPFDPRAPGGPSNLFIGIEEGQGLMLDQFDEGYLKNWAGPEHWKLRRVRRDLTTTALTGATASRQRKEKLPFVIDFEGPAATTSKKLFEPGTKAATTLPAPKLKMRKVTKGPKKGKKAIPGVDDEERDEHLLPDDMHFSSRQLLRLFLKPKFTLKMRRQGAVAKQLEGGCNADLDANFWVQAAAEKAEYEAAGAIDEDDDGGPGGFDTQFFHDDGDADDYALVDDGILGEVPEGADASKPEEDDLWAGTQGQLKRARPDSVHYAKKAKKVDVKRLKDNIWKGLQIQEKPDEAGKQVIDDTSTAENDKSLTQAREFSDVISNLRTNYTNEKMSEISTSFCFICLLHLANEQGLKIEVSSEDKLAASAQHEDVRTEEVVNLEALKVWKKHFLLLPLKRTEASPDFPSKIKDYIAEHFHDTQSEVYASDATQLYALRREWLQGNKGPDIHPTSLEGLTLYHAQISFLLTKFPSDIDMSFTYHLPFPSSFSFQADSTISRPSLVFERSALLYNIAAIYSGLAAIENRGDAEGIKRALAYLQSASGTLAHLRKEVLSTLASETRFNYDGPASTDAGYDMTSSFIETMEIFCLAQAQECFWQRAMGEKYTNGVIAKLAAKVSEFYRLSLDAARTGSPPAIDHIPQSWIAHMNAKKLYFEAVSQYRMSQEDLGKQRYGDEIARLNIAAAALRQALSESKRAPTDLAMQDLKGLQEALNTNLNRATRDNDLIYVSPIPPPGQLATVQPAGMVKAVVPGAIAECLDWLKGQPGYPLFGGLVPYGVHLALEIYNDRKATLIQDELEKEANRIDGLIATRLQILGLPGSITALERPIGLPPSLLKKAEEVFVEGGLQKLQYLLSEIKHHSQNNANLLDQALDLLDQEAVEGEQMLERYPEFLGRTESSAVANRQWLEQADHYRSLLKRVRKSDEEVRSKWEQWAPLVNILAGGEEALLKHVPTSAKSTDANAELPAAARPLQMMLEDLDDARAHRTRLVAEAKRVAAKDDIRSQVLETAANSGQGGSGGTIKPEIFEDLFDKELRKYRRLADEMQSHIRQQEKTLEILEERNSEFLSQRQDDSRVRFREKRLQEMEQAYWKWREILSNCEEGLKFHAQLGSQIAHFKDNVQTWVYSRRSNMEHLVAQSARASKENVDFAHQSTNQPAAPVAEPVPSRFTLPPPTAAGWQSAEDFLPPPPPQVKTKRQPDHTPAEESATSSRRSTRSSAATSGIPPISGFTVKPPRKKGGMAV